MRRPRTAIVVFTRDLRVHDNPALEAAAEAERTIPLFVRDDGIDRIQFSNERRDDVLTAGLLQLDRELRERGGALVMRRGDPVAEILRLAERYDVAAVHMAADVSAHATRREALLRRALGEQRRELIMHDASTVCHPIGSLRPSGGDHYRVFTPYYRRWAAQPQRQVLPGPRRLRLPGGIGYGEISRRGHSGEPAAGESMARRRARRWIGDQLQSYQDHHDDLAMDGTSKLSTDLHFGFLSPVELVAWVRESRGRGADAYVRQLAWRDFHHQVLAARPAAAWSDYRSRGDRWRDDDDALEAWRHGWTGFPLVDAGMRELTATGWMHNRARMVVASFLTKTLYLDWRVGARHFLDHLVDGDLANNNMNWQWVAGTGTDTRPNRVLNPIRQAVRYDPRAEYIRRWVPELSDLEPMTAREPWRLAHHRRRGVDYPSPMVDLDQARGRFLDERDESRKSS